MNLDACLILKTINMKFATPITIQQLLQIINQDVEIQGNRDNIISGIN